MAIRRVVVAEPAFFKFCALSPTDEDIALIRGVKSRLKEEPEIGYPVPFSTIPNQRFTDAGKWRVVYEIRDEGNYDPWILITHIDDHMLLLVDVD